ncbi:segregation and condensation protein A [Vallitalea guaymasensis]|uniref:Segregation and condensation protein A n=1 Tax=Vallitalea guaymasensis TaxID=1185412 RepID=A0A8J8MF55_9FIRM|nr:segregation/condensation protein A [Vallitalea guaymasensis]QUH31786.1 segregation/condensation protein A [Vallitalea guaymasensis]
MSIPVKLEVFEGPLDLLLHLIDKNKLNIYDIPIVMITDQFLEYIKKLEEKNMEIMSEFIEMAATLINIKSKMLLPIEDEEEEETDPREELMNKLVEYKKFKYIRDKLKVRQIDAKKVIFKEPTIPTEVLNYEEKVDTSKLLSDIDFSMIYNVFQSVMKKQYNKIDTIRSDFGEIVREEYTVNDKIDYIINLSKQYETISFRDVLETQLSKVEIIVTFLAVLELMKMGKISIVQRDLFDDIIIKYTDLNNDNII